MFHWQNDCLESATQVIYFSTQLSWECPPHILAVPARPVCPPTPLTGPPDGRGEEGLPVLPEPVQRCACSPVMNSIWKCRSEGLFHMLRGPACSPAEAQSSAQGPSGIASPSVISWVEALLSLGWAPAVVRPGLWPGWALRLQMAGMGVETTAVARP